MDNHIIHSADKPRVPRSGIMNDGSGLKYLLTDHLGSVVAITDHQGNLISQQRYLPFGGVGASEIIKGRVGVVEAER